MTSILWDMGGTLFNTYPSIDAAFHRLVADRGVSAAEVSELTHINRGHAIEQLAVRSGVPASDFEAAYEDVKTGWLTEPAPLMEGALELFEACRKGRGLNLVVTHRDRESAEQLIAAAGLEFDDLISSSDGYPRKPDPTMVQAIMERNNLRPENCIAIGDRRIDAESALAAGVTPVLLTSSSVDTEKEGVREIERLADLLPCFTDEPPTPVNPWAERG